MFARSIDSQKHVSLFQVTIIRFARNRKATDMSEYPYLDAKLNDAFNKLEKQARKAVERLTPADLGDEHMIDFGGGAETRQLRQLSDRPVGLLARGVGYDVGRIERLPFICYLDSQGNIIGDQEDTYQPRGSSLHHFLRSDGNVGVTSWREISREEYCSTIMDMIEHSRRSTYDPIRLDRRYIKSLVAPIEELAKLCKQLR